MYTVKKIGKDIKDINAADHADWFSTGTDPYRATVTNAAIHQEGYRQKITLDMGVNAQFMMSYSGGSNTDTGSHGTGAGSAFTGNGDAVAGDTTDDTINAAAID